MSRSATPATENAATSRWKRTKTRPFATFPIGTATFRHDSNTCTCQEVLLEKIAPKYRRIITDIYSIFFWFLLHSFIIPHFLWVPWQHPGSSWWFPTSSHPSATLHREGRQRAGSDDRQGRCRWHIWHRSSHSHRQSVELIHIYYHLLMMSF